MMRRCFALFVVAAALAANASPAFAAEQPARTSVPQTNAQAPCRKAEVNPVTGHALCFDPVGAPVEAPPPSAEAPCKPEQHEGESWTYRPSCKEDRGS